VKEIRILWTDDEVDLLKPLIIFLEEKGYLLSTASSGDEAIRLVEEQSFDLIFLDENMPGKSGLETLIEIKLLNPGLPVVMVSKSEEEDIMDEAIGAKINDYLIKPVKPNQLLLSIKKNIDTRRLVSKYTTTAYQSDFSSIGMLINTAYSFNDWVEIYKKLTYWDIEMGSGMDEGLKDIIHMQRSEANAGFSRYIKTNYHSWFGGEAEDKPLLSQSVFSQRIFPRIEGGEQICLILVDNLRYDQWKAIQPMVEEHYRLDSEELFCCILPTATQYARNSMFAGLMPLEIENLYPELWIKEDEEGSKNLKEEDLLEKQVLRSGIKMKCIYEKINNSKAGKKLVENADNLMNYDLSAIIFNFVDIISHARTEMEMIKELAYDEPAYRSLTRSWFEHSHLFDFLKELARQQIKVILTTDHGTIRVQHPIKVVGDRKTSANLRYKQGRSLEYDPGKVFEVRNPSEVHLPKSHVSSSFIFASNYDYLVYANNYNHYVNHFRNTFQHGGISMEEMLIPLVSLSAL